MWLINSCSVIQLNKILWESFFLELSFFLCSCIKKISGVRLKILLNTTVDIIRNMQGEYMTEAGNNYSEKETQLHI